MSKLDSLIGMMDPVAGLQIEAALTAFDDYQLPQWIQNKNVEEYMFEWWSVERYNNSDDKKYLLFTYHKLKRKLNVYVDVTAW